MLVTTRKPDEVVQIGDEIRIVVVRARSGEVSLGITAPREMDINCLPSKTDEEEKKQ